MNHKEHFVLLCIPAYNEEDLKEQLESLDCYEVEWWREGKEIK